MNTKQNKFLIYSLLFCVMFQACYIVLITMFPDTTSRKFFLKNFAQVPYMEMNPVSFSLMAMLVSQRHAFKSSLVKYMMEHCSEKAKLMEFLDGLESRVADGELGAMNELSAIKALLDQGGKLYEYTYEKGADSEYGLIVIKDGKDICRIPIINSLELRGQTP